MPGCKVRVSSGARGLAKRTLVLAAVVGALAWLGTYYVVAHAQNAGDAAKAAPTDLRSLGQEPPVSATGDRWRAAAPGYLFAFPRDHASHPDYKIEWWYYTGNVETASGRRFGYQVTFFRVGVDPAPSNPSAWAVRDLYMAHLAVSDPYGRRYRFDEKLTRGGPGLSGAATDHYRVWNEDWTAGLDDRGQHVIRAASRAAAVELTLGEGKGPVINGVNGISQKGAAIGNASHYYSLTRMPTRGTLVVDGERFEVAGESWMDHEFGTSFLEREQQGWDWLSLQLDDGRELMIYQLRRGDGSRDPRSSGTLVDVEGRATHLAAADFTLVSTGQTFRAPSGATYPTGWRVSLPAQQLALEVTTPLANQELATTGAGIAYWEGLVDVSGTDRGRPLAGRGYLEMTGYKGSLGRVMTQ
ncbi:MAG: carotenoid 1,2-hydratase [Acidobacteriota bacterium]|nr:carotenoid 1,2-hydratase [Acidobacteriota bacterium]